MDPNETVFIILYAIIFLCDSRRAFLPSIPGGLARPDKQTRHGGTALSGRAFWPCARTSCTRPGELDHGTAVGRLAGVERRRHLLSTVVLSTTLQGYRSSGPFCSASRPSLFRRTARM